MDEIQVAATTITAGTPFVVPAGATKFRQQVATLDKDKVQIVRGSAFPTRRLGAPVVDSATQARNSLVASRAALDRLTRGPRNLFNRDDTQDGFTISNTGAVYASAGRYVSGFIEVTEGVPHVSNYGSQATFVCYYDESFTILNAGTSYEIVAGVPFVPPAGAYWMRRGVNVASGNIGYDSRTDLYIYAGASATGTVAFSSANASPGDTVTIGANVITFVASGATGAQVNIGASNIATTANLIAYINANTATLKVTAELFAAVNTLRLSSTDIGPAANLALSKSGAAIFLSGASLTGAKPSTLAYNRFGSGGGSAPQNWAGKRAFAHGDSQTLGGKWQPRCTDVTGLEIISAGVLGRGMKDAATDIASVDLSSYDLILNAHMTNDLNRGSVIGTIADDRTVDSFYGHMERWLYNVLSRYPTKRVAFLGAPGRTDMTVNSIGATLKAYNDAMRAFCEKWGIPFLDLLALAGFNTLTYAAGSAWTADGLHYNVPGGDIVGRLKGDFINARV